MGGKGNEEGGGTAFEEGERGEGEGRRAELMFLAPFVVVFFPACCFSSFSRSDSFVVRSSEKRGRCKIRVSKVASRKPYLLRW